MYTWHSKPLPFYQQSNFYSQSTLQVHDPVYQCVYAWGQRGHTKGLKVSRVQWGEGSNVALVIQYNTWAHVYWRNSSCQTWYLRRQPVSNFAIWHSCQFLAQTSSLQHSKHWKYYTCLHVLLFSNSIVNCNEFMIFKQKIHEVQEFSTLSTQFIILSIPCFPVWSLQWIISCASKCQYVIICNYNRKQPS